MLSGVKPLPDSMLTYIYVAIWRHYQELNTFLRLYFLLSNITSQAETNEIVAMVYVRGQMNLY